MDPVRTCVGCRNRSNKSQLIRLVARDGALVVDAGQISAGRGAYLHRLPECWTDAMRTRAFVRKLAVADIDTERLFAELAAVAERTAEMRVA